VADVGEVSELMIDQGEPDTEHERVISERPGGRSRTLDAPGLNTSVERHNGKGTILPSFAEYKAQSISSGPGGGFLVPEVNSSQFFDRLRPQSVVLSSGPLTMNVNTESTLFAETRQQRHGGGVRGSGHNHWQRHRA
jgi:hypothetical protein